MVTSLRAVVGGVMCALMVVCGVLSADEGRHRQLHADADGHEADGACVVCLLIAGGCDAAPEPMPPMVVAAGFSLERTVPPVAAPDRDGRTIRSDRGPPTVRA